MTTLICLVLLPIVPAYLLFAALPAKAAVAGPLKGFKINLSGAFAGYFSLLLLLLVTHDVWRPEEPRMKWRVHGRVVDDESRTPIRVLDVRLAPPNHTVFEDGSFALKFTTDLDDDAKSLVYPHLVIAADGYESRVINLDPAELELGKKGISLQRRQINFDAITLKRLPPYMPAAATNAPVTVLPTP